MGIRGKQQSFSSTWVNQTQLGAYFNLSGKEVGQYLIELGLRAYDSEQGNYAPTPEAFSNELCVLTPLKNGTPFYMWHLKKVSQRLQEHTGLVPLSVPDLNARAMALELLRAEKDAQQGNDKAYYLLFDSIAARELPTIMAWALIMAHSAHDSIYQSILDSVSNADVPTINIQLKRLNSTLRLDHE